MTSLAHKLELISSSMPSPVVVGDAAFMTRHGVNLVGTVAGVAALTGVVAPVLALVGATATAASLGPMVAGGVREARDETKPLDHRAAAGVLAASGMIGFPVMGGMGISATASLVSSVVGTSNAAAATALAAVAGTATTVAALPLYVGFGLYAAIKLVGDVRERNQLKAELANSNPWDPNYVWEEDRSEKQERLQNNLKDSVAHAVTLFATILGLIAMSIALACPGVGPLLTVFAMSFTVSALFLAADGKFTNRIVDWIDSRSAVSQGK